jgi:uncharacterized iron-regulated membrane protein
MDLRKVFLKVHLYLGLVSAIFLIILGLTGSIMAFEGDIDHWLHPHRWYVSVGPQILPESLLIKTVEEHFAPARVTMAQLPTEANIGHLMYLTHGSGPSSTRTQVVVNPYDGNILYVGPGVTKTQQTLGIIHQLHLRLLAGATGKLIISVVGLLLVFEVPLGIILWWRTKRASVKLKGSGFRVSFDLHHAIGVYAAAFLFLAAVTGVLIGFDFAQKMFFTLTHSSPIVRHNVTSTVVEGGTPIGVDKAIEIARQQMPTANVNFLQPPVSPRGVYTISLRLPGEPWSAINGTASVDQYSGKLLQFQNLSTSGYNAIRLNRSLHTGDIFGLPSRIVMSLTSLVLVVMVVTGVIIWWKKLAV